MSASPAPMPRMTRAGWGATATAAAVVAQWLLHQAWPEALFPAYAIGDAIIRATPGDFATTAIEELGHFARDGMVLGVILAMIAAGAAAAAVRPLLCVFVAVAATALAAAISPIEPTLEGTLAAAGMGGAAASLALALFATNIPGAPTIEHSRQRRLIFAGFAGGFVLLASGAVFGRSNREAPGGPVLSAKRLIIEPDPNFAELPGLSARITAPEDHYQVDIDLTRPRIDGDSWRLKVSGEVSRERSFAFEDLVAFGAEERSVYLQCVSNIYAGDLMSNSLWTCVPLARVIAEVEPAAGATHIVARAVDGYHERYAIADAPEILVALGMGDGAVLPDHGYPVRLLVPGHYGVRSVKWLTELELISEQVESYWEKRGWDAEAVLNSGARIDTPSGGDRVGGRVTVGGVAWGPGTVTRVEVAVDSFEKWHEAQLETRTDDIAWTRWQATIDVPPGEHVIFARAAVDGVPQIEEPQPPHPSGATGLHRIAVRVV